MLRTRTWIFFFFSLALQIAITLVLAKLPEPTDILRIQTAFTLESFQSVLRHWSEADRHNFLLHYVFDFFYPWAYGFFFYFLLEDLPGIAKFKNLALLAGLSDELENCLHWMLVNRTIDLHPVSIFAGATFSMAKWLLLLFLTVLVIAHLGKRFKQRSQLR